MELNRTYIYVGGGVLVLFLLSKLLPAKQAPIILDRETLLAQDFNKFAATVGVVSRENKSKIYQNIFTTLSDQGKFGVANTAAMGLNTQALIDSSARIREAINKRKEVAVVARNDRKKAAIIARNETKQALAKSEAIIKAAKISERNLTKRALSYDQTNLAIQREEQATIQHKNKFDYNSLTKKLDYDFRLADKQPVLSQQQYGDIKKLDLNNALQTNLDAGFTKRYASLQDYYKANAYAQSQTESARAAAQAKIKESEAKIAIADLQTSAEETKAWLDFGGGLASGLLGGGGGGGGGGIIDSVLSFL